MEIADLIKETTSTTGTGTITVAGAFNSDFRTIYPTIGIGAKFPYSIRGRGTGQFEMGEGTVLTATTFSRSPTSSSNNNQLVNFLAGVKDVTCELTADFMGGFPRTEDGVQIHQLDAASALADADIFPLSQSSAAKRTTLAAIVAYVISKMPTAPSDTTAPTLSNPTASQTGQTTANGSVTTNEGNGTLYFLATVNATETVATIKANGATQAVSSTGSKAVSITGLTAATQYYLHFVQTDAANNDSTRVTSTAFTTASAADTTAPTLSSPTGTKMGQTTATGSVSTNEANGTLYRYVSTNAVESATTVKAANVTQAVTSTGVQNVSITGLNQNTTYYLHFVHTDASNNTSLVATSGAFTTDAASSTMADTYTATTGVNFPSSSGYDGGSAPNRYWAQLVNVYIKNGTNYPPQSPQIKCCWGKSATVAPVTFSNGAWPTEVPYTANGGSGGNVPSSIIGMQHFDANSYPGLFKPDVTVYGGGTPGNYYFWILYPDGSAEAVQTPVAVA